MWQNPFKMNPRASDDLVWCIFQTEQPSDVTIAHNQMTQLVA